MNEQHIHDALGELSEEILAPVAKLRQKKRYPIAPWIATAACLCLLLCLPMDRLDKAAPESALDNGTAEMEKEDIFYGATMDKANAAIFRAKVLEVYDGTALVEPLEGEQELSSSDKFHISLGHLQDLPEIQVGDVVEITYDGLIQETYPCRITGTLRIKVLE